MTALLVDLTTSHPLDRLTERESAAGVALINDDPRFGPRMRFGSVNLHLPAKADVLAHVPGVPIDRLVYAIGLDNADGSTHEVTVSVTSATVVGWERIEGCFDRYAIERSG